MPQATDIEYLLIGQLFFFPEIRTETLMFVRPEHFYDLKNKIIVSAIDGAVKAMKPFDIYTIHRHITTGGANQEITIGYLQKSVSKVSSSSNSEVHARIIVEKYLLRKIIENNSLATDYCFNGEDPFGAIEMIEKYCSEAKQSLVGQEFEHDPGTYAEIILKNIFEKKINGLTGINTGSDKLNGFLGGWNPSDLIILAGRPGMGKSTRMIEFLKRALLDGKKCALFSLEMSTEQIYKKLFSNFSRVASTKFRDNTIGETDAAYLNESLQAIKKLPLYLNDRSGISVNYIRSICRERKKKYGLDMIFVDYLQIIQGVDARGKSQEQLIADISTGLKNLAKDLSIPIMALCQLSRDVEKRTDKRPIKSDLRHSGQIEQDADVIFAMYRPSQYGEYENFAKEYDNYQLFPYISELLILKNRHGESEVRHTEYFYGAISRVEQTPFYESQNINPGF